jgi:hypothetical protein
MSYYLLFQEFLLAHWPIQPLVSRKRVLFPMGKRPGRETRHSLAYSAQSENEWSSTSLPTYDFMACVWFIRSCDVKYKACRESKDYITCRPIGNFLCLLWQHCRRPWCFTCEPCSFCSVRTGFAWARRVWSGSADTKTLRGASLHSRSV